MPVTASRTSSPKCWLAVFAAGRWDDFAARGSRAAADDCSPSASAAAGAFAAAGVSAGGVCATGFSTAALDDGRIRPNRPFFFGISFDLSLSFTIAGVLLALVGDRATHRVLSRALFPHQTHGSGTATTSSGPATGSWLTLQLCSLTALRNWLSDSRNSVAQLVRSLCPGRLLGVVPSAARNNYGSLSHAFSENEPDAHAIIPA